MGVRLIVERPVYTIETNIKATELILELAARKHRPLLLASTSEVYGKLDKPKFSEEDDVILGPTSKARWCYAASKMIDEFLARAYFKEKGLPTVVARLFNTIGPRQTGQYGMVVPRFARQALRGEPITIYGDGSQTRCFTYVDDAVAAIRALATHPAAPGEVFNVGQGRETSIEALAHLVRDLAGSASPVVKVPYAEAFGAGFEDMQRRVPDVSKLQRFTGFVPATPLEEALGRILAYLREYDA